MTIQNPTYFWALLALLVPLAVHLWSRKAGKTVKVGSTQWLIASENTRFSSLQFNEIGLFLIRSLLVVITVLLLVDLVQKKSSEGGKIAQTWLLTEESFLQNASARPQIDSLVKNQASLHLFKPGMPLVKQDDLEKIKVQKKPTTANNQSLNYWSFLQELDTRDDAPKKVIVLGQNTQQRFTGKRPQIGLEVQWLDLPQQRKKVFLLDALQLPNDSLLLSIGISDENGTQVMQEKIRQQANTKIKDLPSVIVKGEQVSFAQVPNQGINIRKPVPQQVKIYYNEGFALDQQYLKVALETVGEYMQTKVTVLAEKLEKPITENIEEAGPNLAVFLGIKPKDFNISMGEAVRQIKFNPNSSGKWLEQDLSQTQIHYLRQRINPEKNPALLRGGFLEELSQLLFANPKAQKRLEQFDQRKISLAQATPKKTSLEKVSPKKVAPQNEAQSFRLYLWLVLVAGVFVERFIQARRLKV